MNNRFLQLLQLSIGLIDFVVINTIFFLTHYIFKKHLLIGNEIEYVYFISYLNIAWLFLVIFIKIYHEKYVLSFEHFTKISLQSYVYLLLLVIIYLFFFRMLALSRIFIAVVLSCIPVALLINRFIYLALYQYFKKKVLLMNKVAVVGYNNLSKKLVSYLEKDGINKEIVGYFEEYENVSELSNYPIISNIENTFEICKKLGVTEIYSTIAPEHNTAIYNLIQNADQHCIRFKIVPDLGSLINRKIHIDYINEIPVIVLRKEPLEDLGNRIKKRIFDIVVSSLVVVFILSWLIPIVALLIWLESKGPIFFIQERTGKNNTNFRCIKFRSMRVNKFSDHQQATKNDERVTSIGKFLRRTNLDEFPQFLNALRGQMSIVGPRPHMLKHTDEYSKIIGQYMVRQFLKPGITGWAQVNGYRGETQTVFQMQKRVEYDLWYMEHWSILLDVRIMFLTIFNTLKGEKNAF
jgi:putative colanic acid biosynthesis UDP-glucose lipid carrier transferase